MQLKQLFEDFRVTEVAKAPKKDKDGKYTYFWLTKTNYTTVRALAQIARALRISKKRLHFAGTKDKRAITTQLVSVMHLPPAKLKELHLKDIELKVLHKGTERIALGMHAANKFEIIVRDLPQNLNISKVKTASAAIEKTGTPNYFDEQRFSTNNAEVGRALVQGFIREAVELILTKDEATGKLAKKQKWSELADSYEKQHSSERAMAGWLVTQPNDYAGALRSLHKKVRMLYIHAYQSALFNKALSSTIKSGGKSKIIINKESLAVDAVADLSAKDADSFVSVSQANLTLPGYETKLTSSAYDKKLKALLKEDNVKLADFKTPRTPALASPGGTRPASVQASKLKIGRLQKDELNEGKKKVKVSFELPKGAYATLLAKILFAE